MPAHLRPTTTTGTTTKGPAGLAINDDTEDDHHEPWDEDEDEHDLNSSNDPWVKNKPEMNEKGDADFAVPSDRLSSSSIPDSKIGLNEESSYLIVNGYLTYPVMQLPEHETLEK